MHMAHHVFCSKVVNLRQLSTKSTGMCVKASICTGLHVLYGVFLCVPSVFISGLKVANNGSSGNSRATVLLLVSQ